MAKKSSTTVSVNKIAFWLLVVAAIAYLVNATYNPFLYFRF